MTPLSLRLAATFSFLLVAAPAEDLGGGSPAAHGRVARLVLDRWIPGAPSAFRFVDLAPATPLTLLLLSPQRTNVPMPFGTLIADPSAAGAFSLLIAPTTPIPQLPFALNGSTLYMQGAVVDSTGLHFTDATRLDFFHPTVVVGNQRQTANSLSVVDLQTRSVVQTLVDSENGSIAFAPNRLFMYVCEPGLQRNRVSVYRLQPQPITKVTDIPVSGGIRYQPTIARDGKRMYVPIHSGVSVIDVDPSSATFHTELMTIPTPIIGSVGTIFEGPFDLALTPDGTKLYVAYGERVPAYTSPGTIGMIDLTAPGFPHTAIPVTNSGALTLLGTPLVSRQRIEIDSTGRYAYAVEFAFRPGSFVQGFQNGGAINVIDLATNTEVGTVQTLGYGVHEMVLDRTGRNLWTAHNDISDIGQVLRVNIDRRSANPLAVLARITVDPLPFPSGGAFGIGVTPDGATVCVSLAEDGSHPTPVLVTIDALTDQLFGTPITVQSLPATVGIMQW